MNSTRQIALRNCDHWSPLRDMKIRNSVPVHLLCLTALSDGLTSMYLITADKKSSFFFHIYIYSYFFCVSLKTPSLKTPRLHITLFSHFRQCTRVRKRILFFYLNHYKMILDFWVDKVI